jgi:hypothetical protein
VGAGGHPRPRSFLFRKDAALLSWGYNRTLVLALSRGKCRGEQFNAEGAENTEEEGTSWKRERERQNEKLRWEDGGSKFPLHLYKRGNKTR